MSETTVGRIPVVIVEIDQDLCSRTYGVAPCTAAIGVTGDAKCYNTRATCQDTANFLKGTPLTLSFTKPHSDVPKDRNIIPSLSSSSTAPTKINPNNQSQNRGPLGERATASVTFQDHPYSDLLTDPYRDERGYDPLTRGTFWSKWLARNPYYQNRPMRIREGYEGQDISAMRTRHYLIDAIDGPDSSGRVIVRGKDPLKLADAQRSQAPRASTGELRFDITAGATSFDVVRAVAADYLSSGTVRIGDECIQYGARADVTEGGVSFVRFSGLVRGTDGTTADTHSANDGVQECLRYTDAKVWEVVDDLLSNFAQIPGDYIPFLEWEDEGEVWLAQFNVTTLITEPTGVSDLLSELTEQTPFFIWWDERDQEIKLRANRPFVGSAPTLTDAGNIIENSVAIQTDPKQRISQVWVFFDQRNRALELDEEKNYRRIRIRADLNAESPDLYGESRIRKVYARWLQSEAQAIDLAVKLLGASVDNPRMIRMRLDAKDRTLWTADIADVVHRNIVDFDGAPKSERFQVISVNEVQPGETVEYDMLRFQFRSGRFGFYMLPDANDYTTATPSELERGGFYSDADGRMSDGSEGWKYQ